MTANKNTVRAAAATLCLVLAGGAHAQSSDVPTVTTQGTATIERPAEILRMQIELVAKDKEIKPALAKLRERQAAARKQLAELGATPDSVKFDPPTFGDSTDSSEQRMQQMVMMRMQGRSLDAETLAALPVKVSVKLTAEWPLAADSPEELLEQAHELQSRIKQADLGGKQDSEPLTPEEEELAEEMAEFGSYGANEGPAPGTPQFAYVSRISEADRVKALTDAFEQAAAQAERLAAATKAYKLGLPTSLTSHVAGPQEQFGGYAYYAAMMYPMMGQMGAGDSGGEEAVGLQPAKVTYRVMVNATFALVPGR